MKSNEIVSDAELEAFIRSLKKRVFTHRDVTRCYSTFVKNEYHQNDDNGQHPLEIYGRQRSGGKRIPVRWSEQETEALKQGVARLGKGNWSRIIGLYPDIFGPTARTGRDLKKKWNSIELKNNRRYQSAPRLIATLKLPNHETTSIQPLNQSANNILPLTDINSSEIQVDKSIKNDSKLDKIDNPQNLLSLQNSLSDKKGINLIMKNLKNDNLLMISDLPKESDVNDILGIPKINEDFHVSEVNSQLLIGIGLNDGNSLKQNEKEIGGDKDILAK